VPKGVGHMDTTARPGLLEVVRQRIRLKHYSHRTEKVHVHWIWHFALFCDRRHPCEHGRASVPAFAAWWELKILIEAPHVALQGAVYGPIAPTFDLGDQARVIVCGTVGNILSNYLLPGPKHLASGSAISTCTSLKNRFVVRNAVKIHPWNSGMRQGFCHTRLYESAPNL